MSSCFGSAQSAAERGTHEGHQRVAVDLDDVVGLRVGQQLQALAQPPDLLVVHRLHVRPRDEQHVGHRPLLAALRQRAERDAHPHGVAAGAGEMLLEDLLALAAEAPRPLRPRRHDARPHLADDAGTGVAEQPQERRVHGDGLAGVGDDGQRLLERQVPEHLEHRLDAPAQREGEVGGEPELAAETVGLLRLALHQHARVVHRRLLASARAVARRPCPTESARGAPSGWDERLERSGSSV